MKQRKFFFFYRKSPIIKLVFIFKYNLLHVFIEIDYFSLLFQFKIQIRKSRPI